MIQKKGISIGACAHQEQRLMMNVTMEKAFHVLTLPNLELGEYLEREVEKNPILKLIKPLSRPIDFGLIQAKETPYASLCRQIDLYFDCPKQKEIARQIAGSLDEKGFLTLSAEELIRKEEVLKTFQRMDTLGLGARNVQECLLIQLESKRATLIYQVVALHYEDLLQNRLQKISKKLKVSLSDLKEMIQKELRPLNPFPGRQFQSDFNPPLIPDLSISKEGKTWSIRINDSNLPTFEINETYLNALNRARISHQEAQFIRHHLAASRWLIETVARRSKILYDVAVYLLKKQRNYLEGTQGNLAPMTRKEMARALNLSESTISRAISHKAIETPRGIMHLRSFFSYGVKSEYGKVSNQQAKNLLMEWIDQEKEPLSDAALSKKMREQGIRCARRTVAKYRKQLKIGFASQRKLWKPVKKL